MSVAVEGEVLKARFSGAIGTDLLPLAGETFRELAAACAAHGCSAILLDTRGVDLKIDRMGIYQAALALARVVTSKIRVVAVVDPAHKPPDGIFGQLAGIAGAVVAVFTDEPAAWAWLERTRKRRTGGKGRTRRAAPKAARSDGE